MKADKICILILNFNGKNDTLECLESLSKVTYKSATTIVVDNGSKDDSVKAIRENYPNVPIIETNENLGFAEGNNVGIRWALTKPFEWILLLNNDTVVDPSFLEAFLNTNVEYPNAKILGAKIYRYDAPTTIDHIGGKWNAITADFESFGAGMADTLMTSQVVDYVCGACLFMHRSVPETIGLLEPKFFLFWEESDYCFRAKRRGFEIRTAPLAKIWHKVSASFTGKKPHAHYFWWRNRLLWIERNLTPSQKAKLKPLLRKEILKMARHFLIKSISYLFSDKPSRIEKMRINRAGLLGVIHYFLGRFGNCPKWLIRNPTEKIKK